MDIKSFTTAELLSFHAQIGEDLKRRGITRSLNNPTGDFAEYLFCKAYGWKQAPNSAKGFDALDGNMRYQIKARRLHDSNKSRQLSALRDLTARHFDYLAGVLFNADYTIFKAAIIPYDYVRGNTRRSEHTNSDLFYLRDTVWHHPTVRDVTQDLQRVRL